MDGHAPHWRKKAMMKRSLSPNQVLSSGQVFSNGSRTCSCPSNLTKEPVQLRGAVGVRQQVRVLAVTREARRRASGRPADSARLYRQVEARLRPGTGGLVMPGVEARSLSCSVGSRVEIEPGPGVVAGLNSPLGGLVKRKYSESGITKHPGRSLHA